MISLFINPEGLFEKLGLEVEVISSGEHKDMYYRALSDLEREKMQAFSDEAYEQFIQEVARGREMELQEVRELATGEMFMGSQAKALGLVDLLGGLEDAVELAAELAAVEDPVKYRYDDYFFWDMLWGPSLEIPELLRKAVLPDELVLMEEARRGVTPELRYQLPPPGYLRERREEK